MKYYKLIATEVLFIASLFYCIETWAEGYIDGGVDGGVAGDQQIYHTDDGRGRKEVFSYENTDNGWREDKSQPFGEEPKTQESPGDEIDPNVQSSINDGMNFVPSISCPQCMPAAPIAGIFYAQNKMTSPPTPEFEKTLKDLLHGVSNDTTNNLKKCDNAVYSLRKGFPSTEGGEAINVIKNYPEMCLDKKHSDSHLSSCRETYNNYIKYCLNEASQIADQRIANRVGILIATQGVAEGKTECTATILSDKYLITARHCYVRQEGDSDNIIGNDYLTFTPSLPLVKTSPSNVNMKILGELTDNGVEDIKMLDSKPALNNDVIILVLKDPVTLETPELKIKLKLSKELKEWQLLTLIGYQEMRTRRDELFSKYTYLPDGNSPLYYVQNIMMDNSKSCFVGPKELIGFDHNCQSYEGTSGAPIFLGNLGDARNDNGTVYIAGIQSSGNESKDVHLERQGTVNSAAGISGGIIETLLKNGVDLR